MVIITLYHIGVLVTIYFQVYLFCFVFLLIVGVLAVLSNTFVLFLFIRHKNVSLDTSLTSKDYSHFNQKYIIFVECFMYRRCNQSCNTFQSLESPPSLAKQCNSLWKEPFAFVQKPSILNSYKIVYMFQIVNHALLCILHILSDNLIYLICPMIAMIQIILNCISDGM